MSLAGCVSQSDGTAEVTLTDDQVDQILDERFDDFMENTTVEINDQSSDSNQFYNNSSTTHHNYNNESVYNSGAVYNNITGFNQVEYFVVDYRFNKSDLIETPVPIVDHINNSFTVDLNGTDWGLNNSNNSNNSSPTSLDYGEITLPCSGYYIVGQNLGNGNTYWMSSSNYYYEWTMLYNQTVADIYQDNAWDSYIRLLCDENYNGSSQNNNIILTIFEINIPAGKAIQCQTNPSLFSYRADLGYWSSAYGETTTNYWSGNTVINGIHYSPVYMTERYDDLGGTSCPFSYYYGHGERATDLVFESDDLADGVEYRLYLVYSLTDVSQHQ